MGLYLNGTNNYMTLSTLKMNDGDSVTIDFRWINDKTSGSDWALFDARWLYARIDGNTSQVSWPNSAGLHLDGCAQGDVFAVEHNERHQITFNVNESGWRDLYCFFMERGESMYLQAIIYSIDIQCAYSGNRFYDFSREHPLPTIEDDSGNGGNATLHGTINPTNFVPDDDAVSVVGQSAYAVLEPLPWVNVVGQSAYAVLRPPPAKQRKGVGIEFYAKAFRGRDIAMPPILTEGIAGQLLVNGNVHTGEMEPYINTSGFVEHGDSHAGIGTSRPNFNEYFLNTATKDTNIYFTQEITLTDKQIDLVSAGGVKADEVFWVSHIRTDSNTSNRDGQAQTTITFKDSNGDTISTAQGIWVKGKAYTTSWLTQHNIYEIPPNTVSMTYEIRSYNTTTWNLLGIGGNELRLDDGHLRDRELIVNGTFDTDFEGWVNDGTFSITSETTQDGVLPFDGAYATTAYAGSGSPTGLLTQDITITARELEYARSKGWRMEMGISGISRDEPYSDWDQCKFHLDFKDADGNVIKVAALTAIGADYWRHERLYPEIPEGTVSLSVRITSYSHKNWPQGGMDSVKLCIFKCSAQTNENP
ncbi:hypothetical protein HOU76_gp17 [Vibrio phage 1.169.O._10N.261.52.B1]|uniref:Uncharacterized protein n=1 Tax=Vibrio phage 1.169.O._10N.261.52.B1 TaxID=1881213 RepID=A0A2I7REM1_9CAUD|nr:hypothetical protein HOU76_gp17 [Vibrio phage 1.169.O._10N.261.52.B1]AUR92110.1 hypothetical protein NVP1169O_82 [Vibrio phage 1.169.O._10N.261.52.B1]